MSGEHMKLKWNQTEAGASLTGYFQNGSIAACATIRSTYVEDNDQFVLLVNVSVDFAGGRHYSASAYERSVRMARIKAHNLIRDQLKRMREELTETINGMSDDAETIPTPSVGSDKRVTA